jgi:hypothetical protein
MKLSLAEALLLRKDLQGKVDRLRPIDQKAIYETKVARRSAAEGIDDIVVAVPKLSFQQFTAAFDWHAKQLRRVDAVIQRANWDTSVEIPDEAGQDYVDPYAVQVK